MSVFSLEKLTFGERESQQKQSTGCVNDIHEKSTLQRFMKTILVPNSYSKNVGSLNTNV